MENWLRRIKKFLSYSLTEKMLIAEAFCVVLLIRVGLTILSFNRFRHLYASLSQPTAVANISDKRINQYTWAIERVSGSLSAVCLPQALALKFFLRHDKMTQLVIGVEKSKGFSAHAWVEKNGRILIGDSPQLNFQPLWQWQ